MGTTLRITHSLLRKARQRPRSSRLRRASRIRDETSSLTMMTSTLTRDKVGADQRADSKAGRFRLQRRQVACLSGHRRIRGGAGRDLRLSRTTLIDGRHRVAQVESGVVPRTVVSQRARRLAPKRAVRGGLLLRGRKLSPIPKASKKSVRS